MEYYYYYNLKGHLSHMRALNPIVYESTVSYAYCQFIIFKSRQYLMSAVNSRIICLICGHLILWYMSRQYLIRTVNSCYSIARVICLVCGHLIL